MSRGSDPGQIRVMLAAAQGYAVLDREGTRIGAFVELAGGDRIAIRHDGVFVWRRRLLPITTVANVVPDQRAVVLTVDGRALAGTETPPTPAPGTSGIAEEYPHSSGDWRERLESYVAPVEGQADQADLSRGGAEHEPSPHADEAGRTVAREADQPTPEPDRRDQRTAERHLLFISTSGGYALVEREGPPPPPGRGIEMPEQARHHSRTTPGSARISSRPGSRPTRALCRVSNKRRQWRPQSYACGIDTGAGADP
jgi:hypothetical protein